MKKSDYQQLPNSVRERFSSYPDAMFDDNDQVISARRRVEAAEAEHQKTNATTNALAAQKAALEARLEQVKADITAQREARRNAVVAALVGDREIPVAKSRETPNKYQEQ